MRCRKHPKYIGTKIIYNCDICLLIYVLKHQEEQAGNFWHVLRPALSDIKEGGLLIR